LGVLTTYVYDGENRCLNELRGSGAHHTYTYAPDGLRRSAHHGGGANPVSFVWDGDDLLNEYRLGGVFCRHDVLDGEVLGEKRDASRYLFVPDPLGSVNHLLDTSQNIAGTYVYWPYGEVQSHSGSDTKMQFVGGLGYYTGVVNRVYDKAGVYRPDLGLGVTVSARASGGRSWTALAGACFPIIPWPLPKVHRIGNLPIFRPPTFPWFFPPDDLVFRYGHYCGLRNKHNPQWCAEQQHRHGPKLPDWVDCVDLACKWHDECLDATDYWSWGGTACNCGLLILVEQCTCANALNPVGCEAARHSIIAAFSAICAIGAAVGIIGNACASSGDPVSRYPSDPFPSPHPPEHGVWFPGRGRPPIVVL
jgi:hypothetical protein